MNAGKSLELIKVAHNYEERGKRPLILTSAVDDRFGIGIVKSKAGIRRDAIAIKSETNLLELFENQLEAARMLDPGTRIDCVLIDEGQFLHKHHILELAEIVDSYDTPVLVYGLKNDFRNELFEGSMYLLLYADKIEEIKTICWCGRKATMVARVEEGRMVRTGNQIEIGDENYVSLCRRHYNEGRLDEDAERYGGRQEVMQEVEKGSLY